jgi:hypothetical protein
MVIPVAVELKAIVEDGRDFPWPRPTCCPRCHEERLWGHGFVTAYFDGVHGAVFLKRFRCPGCRCVMRLRPRGFFKRFQARIVTIYGCLARKVKGQRYDARLSRSRQRHWLLALQRQVAAILGEGFRDRLLKGFCVLIKRGRVPVAGGI